MTTTTKFEVGDIVRTNKTFSDIYGIAHPYANRSWRLTKKTGNEVFNALTLVKQEGKTNSASFRQEWLEKIA